VPIKMTPRKYFDAFTYANYLDFEDEKASVRKAFNAAIPAFHLADCYYSYQKRFEPSTIAKYSNLGQFIVQISKDTDGYFKDIRSIASAYKHLYTSGSKRSASKSTISSAGVVVSVEITGEDVSLIYEDFEASSEKSFEVVYIRRNGRIILFHTAISRVVKYWETLLMYSL
jgi:hypothetical protein